MSGQTTDMIRRHLVGLKMPRALEALQTTLARIEQGELSALEAIEALLGEEYTTRESRRIKMALQTARLTTVKSLSGYDFSFQPSLDRNRVLALAELDFIERKQCVHFLGPPGTGKSHLAIALGFEAVKAGKSVFFATLAELVDSMRKAEREGKLRERVKPSSNSRPRPPKRPRRMPPPGSDLRHHPGAAPHLFLIRKLIPFRYRTEGGSAVDSFDFLRKRVTPFYFVIPKTAPADRDTAWR